MRSPAYAGDQALVASGSLALQILGLNLRFARGLVGDMVLVEALEERAGFDRAHVDVEEDHG